MAVTRKEVGMAKPDMVFIEFRDDPCVKGEFEGPLATGLSNSYDTWFTRNSKLATVVGPEKKYVRYEDIEPSAYLDKDAVDDPANWGTIGGRTVTAVYRKTNGWNFREGNSGNDYQVSMWHKVFLQLNGNLAEGTHTIDFPSALGMADYSFTFDDTRTRCESIRVNQNGHRPTDQSKYAYLSLWLPANDSNAYPDLVTAHSVTAFNIVDGAGIVRFTGTPTLRITDTTVETGYSMSNPVTGTETYRQPKPKHFATVSAVSVGTTTTITYALAAGETDPSENDPVFFEYLDGTISAISNVFTQRATSVNTVAKTFVLQRYVSGAWGNYDSTGLTYTGDGRIYGMRDVNWCGTYVYGLDYSAFQPTDDVDYYVQIPGFGVSYPIRIEPNRWFEAAKIHAQGEYHVRSGMALDGRFGYTRPTCFRTGESGQTVYKSLVPYQIITENNLAGVGIPQNQPARAPYITANVQSGWGSWMDAGDWDTRLRKTAPEVSNMLTVYESIPIAAARALDFNLPKSSEIFGSDYAALDNEGDLLHSAIFCVASYKSMQDLDGGVSAGMNNGRTDTGSPQDIQLMEPSWLYRYNLFSYAPDPTASYCYAALAFKLARILNALGYTSLATTFATSAESAKTWADGIVDSDVTRDAYYADLQAAMLTAYGTTDKWDTLKPYLSTNAPVPGTRYWANGEKYRYNGDATAKALVESYWDSSPAAENVRDMYLWRREGAWAYVNGPSPDATRRTAMTTGTSGFVTKADDSVVAAWENPNSGYRRIAANAVTDQYGQNSGNTSDVAGAMICAYLWTSDVTYLKVMQDGYGRLLGANPSSLCYTTGFGARPVRTALHEDSHSMGLPVPSGITIYGPASFGGGQKQNNFGSDGLNYLKSDTLSDPVLKHHMINPPNRFSWPVGEGLFEQHLMIEQNEFVTQDTILTAYPAAVFLHAYDGNTDTTQGAVRALAKSV